MTRSRAASSPAHRRRPRDTVALILTLFPVYWIAANSFSST
jgi:hypothetical protein